MTGSLSNSCKAEVFISALAAWTDADFRNNLVPCVLSSIFIGSDRAENAFPHKSVSFFSLPDLTKFTEDNYTFLQLSETFLYTQSFAGLMFL